MKPIGFIIALGFGILIILLIFLGSPSEDADSETIAELTFSSALLAAILVSGLMFGLFLVLYHKLCDVAKKSEKELIMYSFEVVGGGVLFVIATNRIEATEEAEIKHGAGRVSYLSEHPIDKTPFTIFKR